jgi:hypothetical protein
MTARWLDMVSNRTYETPQAFVDEAVKFDDVREGGGFSLRDLHAQGVPVWFRLERGKPVQLPQ